MDEIAIISTQMKDRFALFECNKVQGATRDGTGRRCKNAGSILSDEHDRLKRYENMKVIHASKIIDFTKFFRGR